MRSKAFKACFLLMAVAALTLASCGEDDNTVVEFPNWEETNTRYWNSLYADATNRVAAGDSTWRIYKTWTEDDSVHADNTKYIVVHILEKGTGSGCPLYTDTVRAYYDGHLLPSTSYASGFEFANSIPKGATEETAAPVKMAIGSSGASGSGGLTDGFATAVQHMHIGDKWEVYVPWTLAYGKNGNASGGIPGYSVLRFTIRLHSYYHPGEKVPDFKAKRK